jgi:hypothetical protein
MGISAEARRKPKWCSIRFTESNDWSSRSEPRDDLTDLRMDVRADSSVIMLSVETDLYLLSRSTKIQTHLIHPSTEKFSPPSTGSF